MDGNKSKRRGKQESLESETDINATDESVIEQEEIEQPIEIASAAIIPIDEEKSGNTENIQQQEAFVMSVGKKGKDEPKYFYHYRIDKRRLKSKEGVIINSKEALIRMFVTVENHKIMSRKEAADPEYKKEFEELKAIKNEVRIAKKEKKEINTQVIKDEEKRKLFQESLSESKSIDFSMFPASKKIQMTPKILEEAYIHLQQWCEIEKMGDRKYIVKRVFDKKNDRE